MVTQENEYPIVMEMRTLFKMEGCLKELLTIRHNNDSQHNDSPQLNNDSPQFNNDSPQLNNDSPQFFLLWLYFDNIDINN